MITPMMQQYLLENLLINRVTCIPALDLLALLPDASVDAVITDLPYGTTACAWDEIIPFAPMWAGVKRVLKPRGVFVTTASQPFTSALVMSNPSWFRYSWVWVKSKAADFINANYRPMKAHEDFLVFSAASAAPGALQIMNYYPQGVRQASIKRKRKGTLGIGRDRESQQGEYISRGENYPLSVLDFASEGGTVHSTQKPVALYRYLVRTYTQPGDLVLDFCCGSATTGMACREEERRFVLGEKDADIAATAQARLDAPYTLPLFAAVGGD